MNEWDILKVTVLNVEVCIIVYVSPVS